jgi:hypothetical protein
MPYVPPSGIGTSLDLWSVKFFPLNNAGLIDAPGYPVTAETPYEGLTLPKPKTLQPNLGTPRTIAVTAQGRVQTTFILPPIDPKSIECHLAYLDLDVFAQLSRVKVRSIAGARMMAAGTNKQGFELPGMLLVQQLVGHDDDDVDVFVGYLVPRVKASITWPAFNENPIDVTVTMSVGKSKKHALIGAALTEADDGALESSMFPFISFGLRNIVAWVADGSETTFLLPDDAQANADFADTFKVYNTTDGAVVSGTPAADQFVAGGAPTANDVLLGWYEQALD